jgi:hypothetical protein
VLDFITSPSKEASDTCLISSLLMDFLALRRPLLANWEDSFLESLAPQVRAFGFCHKGVPRCC